MGSEDEVNLAKKRVAQMTECAQQRRKTMAGAEPRGEQQGQGGGGGGGGQGQLMCLAGRMPAQQEARLAELGARYSNVMRATDIVGGWREEGIGISRARQ